MLPRDLPPPDLDIYVQAISAETGEVVQEVVVNPAVSLDFAFPSLPIGEYVFVASSDVDGDGERCEVGDHCGGFPILGDLESVRVIQGVTRTGVGFDVTRTIGAGSTATR